MIILSCLVSFIIGYTLISFLQLQKAPTEPTLFDNILFKTSLAMGAGFSISSLLFFLWIKVFHNVQNYQYFEILLTGALAGFHFYKNKPSISLPQTPKWSKSTWFMGILFICVLIIQITSSLYSFCYYFSGDWDSVNFWTYNAKTFFLSDFINFQTFAQNAVHADYPLLTSSIVAKTWCYIGHFSQTSVFIIHNIYWLLTVLMLVSVLTELKSKKTGLTAGMFLACNALYFYVVNYFTSDVILSYYFLSTLILLFISSKIPNPKMQILTGFMLASAAWVKNEGIIFTIVILTAFILLNLKYVNKQKIKNFLLGFLPISLIIGFFKVMIAHYGIQNDMIEKFNAVDYLKRLSDFLRYKIVAKSFFLTVLNLVKPIFWLFILICANWNIKAIKNKNVIFALTSVILLYVAYYFIYITTYLPLIFHLNTSLARLMVQLFPITIFAVSLLLGKENEPILVDKK